MLYGMLTEQSAEIHRDRSMKEPAGRHLNEFSSHKFVLVAIVRQLPKFVRGHQGFVCGGSHDPGSKVLGFDKPVKAC